MIETGSIITGSFILQKILGERWDKTDIDIFVPAKLLYDYELNEEVTFYNEKYKFGLEYTSLHKFLYKNIDKMEVSFRRNREYRYGAYQTHSQYKDELGENVILRVNRYIIGGKWFEVVEINEDSMKNHKEFIEDHSDFDICKNYFRYDKNGQIEFYIYDLKTILQKKAIFNYVNDFKKSLQRCKKYIARGFKFEHLVPILIEVISIILNF